MLLTRCFVDNKKGWKWGESGTCYTGKNARQQALAQRNAVVAKKEKKK